jgi:hypothetical protein
MPDALDSLLPVATLLLGAGLANLLKFTELRRSLRLDAADQLAGMPALLWNKTDPEAWINVNTALSRLSIRLSLAGVHPDLIERVEDHAMAFWHSVHVAGQDDAGEDVWAVGENSRETWDETSGVVARLLGTSSRARSWWYSRGMRRQLRVWDAQEAALLASVQRMERDRGRISPDQA